ncbi:hypothetical protein [Hydrocarboniphaga sp.]|uniref:hypothetical protein n=1 Tax=Hydrocarboniphaga sp. TaxID=2033016 RepID=UPI003D116DDC
MSITLLAASGIARAAADADGTRHFYGYAYDLKSNKYLYTEVYEQHYQDGQWKGGRIRFYAPDGKPIGDKTLDFSANPYIPTYRFEIPAEKYVEAITAVGKTEVKLQKTTAGKTSDKSVAADASTAGDSGFHNYLVAHFDSLMKRETLAFNFIVAGNLDRYKFRAHRIEDGKFENKTAVRFVVEPDSFLRYLVSPLQLSYDPDSKKLLEYRGISNVHDPATGKAYNARIVYPEQPPADAPKTLPPLGFG